MRNPIRAFLEAMRERDMVSMALLDAEAKEQCGVKLEDRILMEPFLLTNPEAQPQRPLWS